MNFNHDFWKEWTQAKKTNLPRRLTKEELRAILEVWYDKEHNRRNDNLRLGSTYSRGVANDCLVRMTVIREMINLLVELAEGERTK